MNRHRGNQCNQIKTNLKNQLRSNRLRNKKLNKMAIPTLLTQSKSNKILRLLKSKSSSKPLRSKNLHK